MDFPDADLPTSSMTPSSSLVSLSIAIDEDRAIGNDDDGNADIGGM